MAENRSGVKFESAQAERNIDSFVRKVTKLVSNARAARDTVGGMATKLNAANTQIAAAGVNADKAARGVLSFGKSAATAANAARGLMSSLSEARIGSAARALGTLSERAAGASISLSQAAKASGSLATQAGRATTATARLRSNLTGVASAGRSAEAMLSKVMAAVDSSKVSNAARAFGSLVGSFRASSARMGTFARDSRAMVSEMNRVAPSSRLAVGGINRFVSSIDAALPKMSVFINKAKSMQNALGSLSGARVTVTGMGSRGGGNSGSLPSAVPPGASTATQAYSAHVSKARRELGGMADQLVSLRNLFRYYIAGLGIAELAKYADTVNLVRARLNILATSSATVAATEKMLQSVSLNTRSSYEDNAKLYVKLAQAGKAYGVTASTTMQITENVAKAMKISGASTEEATSATTQLAQAFASGRFQGDELRSVLENSPRLAQAFSEKLAYMGVNLSNIRQYAKEGKIGIKEMVAVLGDGSLTKELTEEFAKIPMTMGDALTQTKTKLTFFIGDLDKQFGVSNKVVAGLQWIGNNLTDIASAGAAAGAAVVLSYVPAMVAGTRASMAFIGLGLAKYFVGIRDATAGAAAAQVVFGRNLKVAATGQGLSQLTAMTGTMKALGPLITRTGLVFGRVIGGWPAILVAVGLAMLGFRSKFRPVATEAATTADYMAVAFEGAARKIYSAMTWAMDGISGMLQRRMEEYSSMLDFVYKGAKWLATRNPESLKTGFSEDLARSSPGLRKAANIRAETRAMDKVTNAGWNQSLMFSIASDREARAPGFGGLKTGGDTGGSKSKGKSDAEKARDKAKREAEQLADALKALKASIDPVEAARQKFNDGVDTLSKSMKAGTLSTEDYKRYLGSLATDTFPGLADQIKDLERDNENLLRRSQGTKPVNDKILTARDDVAEQIDLLDKVIAKQGDSTGQLAAQKKSLQDQLGLYEGLVRKNDDLTVAAERRAKKEQQIADLIQNAMERTQEMFVNSIDKLLSGQKGMLSSLFSMGKSLLSQYLGNAMFSKVEEGLRGKLEGLFGTGKKRFENIGSAAGNSGGSSIDTGGSVTAVASTVSKVLNDSKVRTTPAASNDNGGEMNATNGGQEVVVQGGRTGFLAGIASGYKDSMSKTGKGLVEAFRPVGKVLGKAADKLGLSSTKLGQVAGRGLAGAQVGSATADVAKALGIGKYSRTGATVGGAIGGMTGIPGGQIIGSIAGGIIGGLFKKTKQASATVDITNGYASGGEGTGNGKEARGAASALARGVAGQLNNIASGLGGTLAGSIGTTIGYRPGHKAGAFRVDDSGRGGLKGSTVKAFETEEEAVAYAVGQAVKKGVITGLSETATKVLRTFSDTTRAVEVAGMIETVKRQALEITNPLQAAFEAIKKNSDSVVAAFREAGASSADWADLNTVLQKQYKDAIDQSMSGLLSFRDSLKFGDRSYASPVNKLAAANDKFSSFEKKIASGDFKFSQTDFTDAGSNLQAMARDVYGSTPEFAAFQQRLIDATSKVVDNAQATADSYKPVVDAILQQTDTLSQDNQRLLDALANLNGVGGGSGGDIQYGGNYNFNQSFF